MEHKITDRKRTMIFINIVITCIASSMLATALTTALPSMITDLEISVTTGQWLTSGYSLAMGIIMPLTAFLITRFPTKRLFLTGMILFILGLALCVIAPNFPVMMAARILQACGNGILTSMSQVIILTIFPLEKRGTAMGWYGLSVGAAPVIAPTLAGIIVDLFGWRAIFYISIGIMLVSFIWALFAFDNVLETAKKKFDMISFGISIFAFGGITLGIGNIGTYEWTSPQALPVFVIGCAALFCHDGIFHADAPLRTVCDGIFRYRLRLDRTAGICGHGGNQSICGKDLRQAGDEDFISSRRGLYDYQLRRNVSDRHGYSGLGGGRMEYPAHHSDRMPDAAFGDLGNREDRVPDDRPRHRSFDVS